MSISAEDVRQIIATTKVIHDMSKLQDGTRFSDIGVDSLDEFNIYLAIEEAYGFKIPDQDIDGLGSITSIVKYLNEKRA